MSIPGADIDRISKISNRLYSLNDLMGQVTLMTILKSEMDRQIAIWDDGFREQYFLEIGDDAWELTGGELAATDTAVAFVVAALQDSLDTPSPRFTFACLDIAHTPFIFDEHGKIVNNYETGKDVKNYISTHRYAVKILLGLIDMVVEKDPDAVIVIQGDHGIHHVEGASQMINEWGFTLQQVRDVWNGVLSAVRIPEKYGGLERPMDPLNITRELVNRFVGLNYELLPPNHPNQRKPELTDTDWANWSFERVLNG